MVGVAGVVVLERLAVVLEAVLVGVAHVGEQEGLARILDAVEVGVADIAEFERLARILDPVLVGIADIVVAVEKLSEPFRPKNGRTRIDDLGDDGDLRVLDRDARYVTFPVFWAVMV